MRSRKARDDMALTGMQQEGEGRGGEGGGGGEVRVESEVILNDAS